MRHAYPVVQHRVSHPCAGCGPQRKQGSNRKCTSCQAVVSRVLAVVKGPAVGPKGDNVPTAEMQVSRVAGMQSFRAWFQGGSRVLAVVKSPAVGPKGNNVPTAKVQVSRSAGMQVSRLGSRVGPGFCL